MKKTILLLFLLSLFSMDTRAQSEATYSVKFTSNWTQTAHPHPSGNLPANAHWSKLVGATHNSDVVFFEMGGTATEGIENIAETGNNTVFFSEVNTAINANSANSLIDGDDLPAAEGEINIGNIVTTEDYPLLTLLSMIAPSPDWIIGVNSISLVDGNGDWQGVIQLDLYPYDAGTDSGVDYTSSNVDTNPKEPISSLQGVAPFSNEVIGTLTITLENVLGVNEVTSSKTVLFPNPANDNITISSQNNLQSVTIYNVLGAQVMQTSNLNSKSTDVNISDLPSGVYLVKIEDDGNSEGLKRLVKL